MPSCQLRSLPMALELSLAPLTRPFKCGMQYQVHRLASLCKDIHSLGVTSLNFSPDGALLFSGSYGKTVRKWGVADVLTSDPFPAHSNAVNSVAFSPDGTQIVSGSDDFTVRLWDAFSDTPTGAPMHGLLGRGFATLQSYNKQACRLPSFVIERQGSFCRNVNVNAYTAAQDRSWATHDLHSGIDSVNRG